jgi:hypothetical protein
VHKAQSGGVRVSIFRSALIALLLLPICSFAADKPTREQLLPRLASSTNEAIASEKKLLLSLKLFGKTQELKVISADATKLAVDMDGSEVPVAWATLSDRELLGAAKRIAGNNGVRLLLAAEVARAFDYVDDATWLLVKAREADPNLIEDTLAIAASLPKATPKPVPVPIPTSTSDTKTPAVKPPAAVEKGSPSEPAASVPLPLSGGLPARTFTPTLTAGPKDYVGKLAKLKPGAVLMLEPGTYVHDLQLSGLNGAKDNPIIITGPPSGSRAVFIANDNNNTVELRDCSFVQVCNLELDGKGLDGPFGVSYKDGSCHDITIEGLYIHDYSGSQGTDGISTKKATWNWVIRNNVIERAGTGMYLGNSDGSCPFINGLIEHNLIVDTVGYNIQIKHQNARPEVPGITKATTIIRHNVFVKSRTFSNSVGARPNLLVGHPPETGTGADDQFLIYGNFFWKNSTEALFQGEGHIAFFDNVCVNPDGIGVRIQRHNGKPKTVAIFNNTFVTKGEALAVSGAEPGHPQFVAGNAAFGGGMHGPGMNDNITGSYDSAAQFLVNPFGGPGDLDCFPLPGKLRASPLDANLFKPYLEYGRDFNGRPQDGSWRGAYAGEGKNPGWHFSLSKKTLNGDDKK